MSEANKKDGLTWKWAFGAAVILFVGWLILLAAHYGTVYWVDSYEPHQAPSYVEWFEGVMENLQSEIWQIWLAAIIFKHFRWIGTPESK
jgi:hypothetical protein